MTSILDAVKPYAAWLLVLAGCVPAGVIAYHVLWFVLRRVVRRTPIGIDDIVVRRCGAPSRLLLPLLALHLVLALAPQTAPAKLLIILHGVLVPLAIGAIAWLLIRVLLSVEEYVLSRYDIEARDNLRARRVYTQMRVIRHILVVIIIVLAAGAALMNYEAFRQVGTGILASAGIAGIVVGLAAQRTLANILAGIQIAITQPIRLDDVVIVEGEWGRIEEITLTYVVVRIWDLRRLVVPISYFIEKPFQNWTRVSADLLGTVFLYTDSTVPVDAILEASAHWDGKVKGVLVTNAGERTMEIRALMSAADSGAAWNLRCEVREKLIAFLQKNYPRSLPRLRVEEARSR
jgi:small-conductance mechanosensitive channel